MHIPQLRYFEQGNILHLTIAEGKERHSVEVCPSVTLEVNTEGEVMGVEILNATRFIRDLVLESTQAIPEQIVNIEQSVQEQYRVQTVVMAMPESD